MARLIGLLMAFALSLAAPVQAQAAFGDRDCSFGIDSAITLPASFGVPFSAVSEPGGSMLVHVGFQGTGSELFRIAAAGATTTLLGSEAGVIAYTMFRDGAQFGWRYEGVVGDVLP